ncbi:MAG: TIGR01906 family membrane protein [Dehalococcoidia bacterium]|nr:TIGR01906 family membrane protein [Dehalococcoidia bacterium]
MPRLLVRLATALVVIAVPLAAIGGAVRVLFNAQPLYEMGFDRYQVSARTGIPREDLSRVASGLISYFNNSDREFNLEVAQRGAVRPVFTDKEVRHMVDVKTLVVAWFRVHEVALLYVALFAIVAFVRSPLRAGRRVGDALVSGALLTVSLLIGLGALTFVDFDRLWLQFHYVAFPGNDDWLLDPRIHNLIAMFPEPFWFDSVLLFVLLVIGQAAVALIVGWQARRFLSPRSSQPETARLATR